MSGSYYEFFCPVKVVAGQAALENIPFELSSLGAKRPLVVTDAGVLDAGLVEPVLAACTEGNLDAGEPFADVPPDSSLAVVTRVAGIYRQRNCDALIAVGGGSVIDTCKGVNILVSEGGDDLGKYAGANVLKRRLKPFFVIPTTAGTGSEVTAVAVIADPERGVKLAFSSSFLLPDVAVLDPRMTLTLPPRLTAMTGMDAMTHAIEAFIGLQKNPLSDAYALAAIKKISEHLLAVMDEPSDAEGRLELAQASTMAGIAFSNSMVGLVHALGHSTGAACHLPHGLCMSIFLPHALEYNLEETRSYLAELLLPLAGPEVFASTPAERRAERAIGAIRSLRDALYARCQLPRTLEETGKVERSQLRHIAELALDDGSIVFSPREVALEDALAVAEKAWS